MKALFIIMFTLIIGGMYSNDEVIVTATIYHAVEGQTDSTPLITASGKHIDPNNPEKHRWIAVSRDLEPLGFTFGTEVIVEGALGMEGIWIVQDRMNKRWKHRIDFLVNKEKKLGKWENVKIKINI
jgi:3D (Asp-Asp-Asp) domain-containing protein